MKLLSRFNFIRRILANRGYYKIEDLQIGGRCGLCGTWKTNQIVEKEWPVVICDKCAGNYYINITEEFTNTPCGRYREHGQFSGEEFRDTLLEPLFLKAKAKNGTLFIDFDGGFGYGTDFLEEAFGGLARKYTAERVSGILSFKSDDEPSLVDKINEYILHCNEGDGTNVER